MSNLNLLEPGSKIKPIIDVISASKLIENHFHVKVIKIIEIDSYDDRNYLVNIETPLDQHGKKFVFKITNSLDTSIPGLIEAVNDLTNYVELQTNFKVPYPILDSNGKSVSRIGLQSSSTEQFAVRLLKFVPGMIMKQIDYSGDVLFQVGESLAILTNKLKLYSNPVLEKRQTIWSLLSFDRLDKFLFAIANDQHRLLISNCIEKFKSKVVNKVDKISSSIIHGDFNEQNIILDKVDGSDQWSVVGLIDFADSHKAPTIFDLAILCCYVTLDSQLIDPIEAPGYVISGYQSVIQISEQEWDILPICVMARLAQSLTLGAYSYRNDQGNEYILSSAKKGWSILEKLSSYDDGQLIEIWKKVNIDSF